ncbi:TPA: hypothetical protein ACH9SK_005709, partial [Escherichia coli]
MSWMKLTEAERKRINDAYAAQAAQLKLSGRDELPREVKRKVRVKVLRMIRAERKARTAMNRPGFPGECFICELRLPDHRFRWKHNK